MNIALVSLNDAKYQPLSDYTWTQNKEIYAEKHGYAHACKTDNFYGVGMGFEKIWFIKDMLDGYPDIDWIWWTGCDSLITNMTIKLEDRIDNNYHFIIAKDSHNFNADSFFIRNSPEGRAYIDMIISKYPEYKNNEWAEQGVMCDTYKDHKDIIKVLPQRAINAYNYDLYPEKKPHEKYFDRDGNDGQWKPGDLLIHWPGSSFQKRMQLAPYYMSQIVV